MDRKGENGVVKNSIAISLVVLAGKVLGFIKQSVIAWAFGANATTDIYFAADGYTSMFGQILGQSVAPTVVTQYVKLDEEGKKEEAKKLVRQCLIFFGVVGILLVLVNTFFSSKVCDLIGISYTAEQKEELQFFVIALCPVMLFSAISGVAQGYLDANKRFLPGKLCSLFFSVSIIISVCFFKNSLGIRSILYGFLFGYLLHTVYVLFATIVKTGVVCGNPFKNSAFRQMLKKFVPLLVGNSIVDIGHLIDKIVASSLISGSISALYYGQVVSSDLVNAVIISSIGTVLLTNLTRTVSNNTTNDQIKEKLQYIICAMTLLTGLITSLYYVEGNDLIRVLFERGNFDSNSTMIVSSVVFFYSFGFIFMASRDVLIKAHYAFQDTLSPMLNSIIGVLINLVGSIMLSKIMGVTGVACATSISMMIVSLLSFFTIKKHLGRFPVDKNGVLDIIKIVSSVFFSAIVGSFINGLFSDSNIYLRIVLVTVLMASVYFIICLLLHETISFVTLLPLIKKTIRKLRRKK